MKLKRILCALLSVCMISLPISMSVFSAGAESISSLQQKLEDLEKQNKDYQSILDKAESDIKDKEEYKDALVNKIKNLNDKIAITRNLLKLSTAILKLSRLILITLILTLNLRLTHFAFV